MPRAGRVVPTKRATSGTLPPTGAPAFCDTLSGYFCCPTTKVSAAPTGSDEASVAGTFTATCRWPLTSVNASLFAGRYCPSLTFRAVTCPAKGAVTCTAAAACCAWLSVICARCTARRASASPSVWARVFSARLACAVVRVVRAASTCASWLLTSTRDAAPMAASRWRAARFCCALFRAVCAAFTCC